jgi:hypothetical protein
MAEATLPAPAVLECVDLPENRPRDGQEDQLGDTVTWLDGDG